MISMKYEIVIVTLHAEQLCSLRENEKAAIVDPGGDLHKLKACLDKHGLTLEKKNSSYPRSY